MWGGGENVHGCLGVPDNRHRILPQKNEFCWDKRIIDFACGKRFSVIIVENYEMRDAERHEHFMDLKEMIQNVSAAREYKKPEIKSIKKDVKTTRKFVNARSAKLGIVPEDLRHKIQSLLIKSTNRHGQEYETVSNSVMRTMDQAAS